MHNPLRRLLPLDPLRGFVAAARHLSFTRAAEELFLTQSAISRQVQALEDALGVRLFVRGVRTLALTAEGARLARAAQGWLDDYAALADALRARGPRPVTVTATIGISALWLVPRLSRFQARYPDIDVRVAASNRVFELGREGVDLAVRYCADRDAPAGAEHLFGESVVPVASPVLAARPLDATTLPDTVLLDFDDPRYPWLRWSDWLAAMGLEHIRPRAVLVFNHYDQLIQAAVAGQGIAIGRAQLLDQLLADSRLQCVGGSPREIARRGFWLVTAPGAPRPEVARFAEWLRAEGAATA
ncbi:LysR substrate-binding domain-containing protein [Aromatoleum bremense]|uniref:LysR family transcriptional regulator n=1 Tax=Aromatoleum bremense TaxID=76115 RepID=A0ABX1NV33_9RHOO|nr:LysR substrate-binding domain-containing protein [Aromatoleum bremense]NMG15879.1 LysR family transcriptional regulator [Aromatoleum bremense]QTQ32087.1 Transcriptional regulator, LysR family [Aromatoleum bremense]